LLCGWLITDICYCDSHQHISYLTLTYIHLILAMPCLTLDIWPRYLPCLSLDIWHRYLSYISLDIDTVLGMLYLLFDIWYRNLPCYTYYLISDTGTCHAIRLISDAWYNNTWHLTWYCGTCIILHIHDYYFYRDLAWLLYCYQIFDTPELLYSWTPVLLNSCILEPLKKGDSWYYTPDIILLLIPVVG